jgi:lysozyme family protein
MTKAPWPLDPLGSAIDQVRWICWEFEGAKFGHKVIDHPKDPGGRTLSGLTWKTYSLEYLKRPDLCPVEDFDALTLDDVVRVMVELFAMRPRIWEIADPTLRLVVLDFAIHAGAHDDAIPALQRAIGVKPDGHIGRDTLAAIARHLNPRLIAAAVLDDRYRKAGRVVTATPAKLTFLNGWIDRFGRLLRIGAAASLVLALVATGAAGAQDGGELANGRPRASLGTIQYLEIGTRGTEPVTVQASPAVALAPATVRVRITVERDARNRELLVTFDGPQHSESFVEQLDGDAAARTRERHLKNLPGGVYALHACVRRSDGTGSCATPARVEIIGFGDDNK